MSVVVNHARVQWAVLVLIAGMIGGLIAGHGTALAQDEDWRPPVPDENAWDWIMLHNGEWLGGELLGLHNDKLEFDSDEMGVLYFDFGDVEILRSPRTMTVGLLDRTEVSGVAVMHDGVLKVQTRTGEVEIPKNQVLGIIAGTPTEWNYWSFKVSAGLVTRSGNTEQDDFSATVLIRRQTTKTRLDISYLGNYSKVKDVKTVNNHRLGGKFDYIISRTLFVTPLGFDLFSDDFTNIDLRSFVGVGVGVDLIDRGDMEWFVQLGGGYQQTRYLSVEAGQDDKDSNGAVVPATSFNWDITGDIEFLLDFAAQLPTSSGVSSTFHTYGLLSFELTSILDFDVGVTWDRVTDPKPREDGSVPEEDDFRTSFGLGIDF